MFNINTETYLIELTRGDSASIIFGAKDAQGNYYIPVTGDELKFAVAKKVGADPILKLLTRWMMTLNPFGLSTFRQA